MQNATNKKRFSCFRIVSRAMISTHCFWLPYSSRKKKVEKKEERKIAGEKTRNEAKGRKRTRRQRGTGNQPTNERKNEKKKEKERFETRLFRERMYYTVLMTMSEAVFELEIRRCLLNPRTRRASTSNRLYKHGRSFALRTSSTSSSTSREEST